MKINLRSRVNRMAFGVDTFDASKMFYYRAKDEDIDAAIKGNCFNDKVLNILSDKRIDECLIKMLERFGLLEVHRTPVGTINYFYIRRSKKSTPLKYIKYKNLYHLFTDENYLPLSNSVNYMKVYFGCRYKWYKTASEKIILTGVQKSKETTHIKDKILIYILGAWSTGVLKRYLAYTDPVRISLYKDNVNKIKEMKILEEKEKKMVLAKNGFGEF